MNEVMPKTRTLTASEIEELGALTDTYGICSVLGVTERYARKLCADGAIKAVKLGRMWRVNVDSLLTYAGLK